MNNIHNLYFQFNTLKEEKDSIILLGLDPKNVVDAAKCTNLSLIQEGIVGCKPNLKFYQESWGRNCLMQISKNLYNNHLISILDAKSSDGAPSNNAEFSAFRGRFYNITIAPAAGDIEATIKRAKENSFSSISMGVMSFPGFLRGIKIGYDFYANQIDRAILSGTSAFVMGATGFVPNKKDAIEKIIYDCRNSKDDPISVQEMDDYELEEAIIYRNSLFKYILQRTQNKPILYLVLGFGRQGGNIEYFLESGIDLNRCMINAGSDILKAENSVKAIEDMNKKFNSYR